MFARLARRLAVILGFLLSIYGVVYVQQTQGSASKTSCVGRHDVAFATTADPATQRAVTAVACATSEVRGLLPRTPVMVHLDDAVTMRALIVQLAQRDAGYRSLQQTASALQLLGAVSSSDNIAAISSSKYNPGAIAQYSQYDRTLHVRSVNGQFTPLDLAVVAHEYERGLQDQYFNLGSLLADTGSGTTHNSDSRLAREAVVEGDAFTTMLNYATAVFNHSQTLQFNQQLQRVSQPTNTDFLQDLVGFPTSQGTTFVSALRTAAGQKLSGTKKLAAANDATNQALRNPPGSTAAVLNPAQYTRQAGTLPQTSTSVTGLSTVWSVGASDVIGAFGLSDLLQRNTASRSATAQAAQAAAAAWVGDRWVLYQHSRETVLIWRLRFSNASAALSFVTALTGFTAGRFHTALTARSRIDWATTGYALAVRQQSDEVLVAIGSDKSLLSTCTQALSALGFS